MQAVVKAAQQIPDYAKKIAYALSIVTEILRLYLLGVKDWAHFLDQTTQRSSTPKQVSVR